MHESQQELANNEQAIDGKDSGDNGRKDDVEQLLNKDRKEPYKLLYQNIRRLITKNSIKKIDYLKEYTQENNIILMNFTETWLDDSIANIIDIKKYQIWRSDRKGRDGGGTAIYVNEEFESNLLMSDSFDSCEIVAIYI